jgi:hypothetical protein
MEISLRQCVAVELQALQSALQGRTGIQLQQVAQYGRSMLERQK